MSNKNSISKKARLNSKLKEMKEDKKIIFQKTLQKQKYFLQL